MKAHKRMLGVFLAGFVAVFALSACSETVQPTDSADGNTQAVYSEYVETSSYDLLVDDVEFEDGTLENEIRVKPNRGDLGPTDRKDGDRRPDTGMRHPFGRLLNALNLTEEQRPQVAELLKAHHDCVKEAHAAYRAHMAELFAKAREARAEIMEAYRNGDITREEAREKISALNKRLRNAIQSDGIFARVREMMKSCDAEFYRALAGILDDDQLALLRRYIASLQG